MTTEELIILGLVYVLIGALIVIELSILLCRQLRAALKTSEDLLNTYKGLCEAQQNRIIAADGLIEAQRKRINATDKLVEKLSGNKNHIVYAEVNNNEPTN